MDEKINQQRRFLMGGALATTGLSALGFGPASMAAALPASAGRSLGTLRQVCTAELEIGYAELGPATGQPVILLHGWPYDIHSFEEVAPLLAGAGCPFPVDRPKNSSPPAPSTEGTGPSRRIPVEPVHITNSQARE